MEVFIMCITKRMKNELFIDWANRVNLTPNTNKSKCYFDGNILLSGTGYALVLPETGDMPRYMCPTCKAHLETKLGYHGNANERALNPTTGLGTVKIGSSEQYTIGVEIEHKGGYVLRKARYSFKVLIERAFNVKEESDCTVDGEFPTDKMNGANILSKVLRKLEKYGFISFLDIESVGAHIHVECTCIEYVCNWYNTLFCPLSDYLTSHNNTWLVDNFGRSFGSFRESIDRNTNCMAHSNFVNCQHNHTLEFRLPRIASADQFMNDVYFWRDVVALLNNTSWIERTSSNRDARKAQAQGLSQEIVRIAKGYFGD
jgi:hypothetical protein